MQLHWAWAALAALALGVGVAWWTQSADKAVASTGKKPQHDKPQGARSHADGAPMLYRWIDANGVVNITTEHPPPGRHFTIVHIDPNQNIVPMSRGDDAAKIATKPR